MKKFNQQFGFSVIEVLVVITAISLIAGVAAISMAKGKAETQGYTEAEKIAQIIREAQSRSETAELGSVWSVRCNVNSVDLLSLNPEIVQETYDLPVRFTCSASGDISFDKLTGIPAQDYDLYLLHSGVNDYRIEIKIPGTVKIISL
jgi:prepilin-type N-terminal cleavage/methylation domain-containing protein